MARRRRRSKSAVEEAHSGSSEHAVARGRGWRRLALAVAALALLAAGVFLAGRWYGVHRLHSAIPVMPDVSAQPAAFAAALTQAQDEARSTGHAREGLEKLGRLYHANGYLDEAASCWNALHRVEPDEARWCYYLADIQRLAGDESNMRPLLEATVRLASDYAPAWLKLGALDFAAGRLDDAEHAYQQRLNLLPDDPYATFGLARVALQRGQTDEARKWLEKSIAGKPDLPSSHNLLANLLEREGDATGATQQRWLGTVAGRFREAPDPWIDEMSAACFDVQRLLTLGGVEFQTQHGDYGKSFFERAIELAPEDPAAYENLAQVYLDADDGAAARDVLARGIQQVPTATAKMYLRLSEAYRLLAKPDEALRAARRGLEDVPDDPGLLNAVGKALDALGRYDEAIEAFRSAMTDPAHSVEPNVSIALVMEHSGHKDQAYQYLNRALELQPGFPKALAELGALELDAWHLESAENYIRGFYSNYPGSKRARELMTQLNVRKAIAATREGDLAAAERACRDGLEIEPESSELNAVLGTLYAQQKRFTEAVSALEKARKNRPADPRILLTLARVDMDLGRVEDARSVLLDGERRLKASGDVAGASHFRELLDRLPAKESDQRP